MAIGPVGLMGVRRPHTHRRRKEGTPLGSLLHTRDRARLDARLARVTPESDRRWGRMTAPQMVCHLTDAFRGALGERAPAAGSAGPPRRAPLLGRTVVKWAALYLPVPWPHGLRTAAAADAERGGTRPGEFADDVAALRAACERFWRGLPAVARRPHFLFGPLTEAEWARWGYRHVDHHLRQFGL